jgi:hypothetical protein
MLTSQGLINMYSRLLLLPSWLQGFFTWIHGFKDSSLGFMALKFNQSQALFTWIHGLKSPSLGFMASIIKQYPFFIATS